MNGLLLSDVEDSIADVVCRGLPVSVDEAAAPAVLTHCQRTLTLRQVKDFVKSSSLGAVVSSSVLVPADTQRSCSAGADSTPRSRNLNRAAGADTG